MSILLLVLICPMCSLRWLCRWSDNVHDRPWFLDPFQATLESVCVRKCQKQREVKNVRKFYYSSDRLRDLSVQLLILCAKCQGKKKKPRQRKRRIGNENRMKVNLIWHPRFLFGHNNQYLPGTWLRRRFSFHPRRTNLRWVDGM